VDGVPQGLLDHRIEGEHGNGAVLPGVGVSDRSPQGHAHVLGERGRIALGSGRTVGERAEHVLQVAE